MGIFTWVYLGLTTYGMVLYIVYQVIQLLFYQLYHYYLLTQFSPNLLRHSFSKGRNVKQQLFSLLSY